MPQAKDPTPAAIPMAPEPAELARAYADIALGYNRRLPELEARVKRVDERSDHTHGVAISAHGGIARVELRVEEIALKLGLKRTVSGSMVAVTPPEAPIEIRTTASKTGSHFLIDHEELERLKQKFLEKEAEERGAKQALVNYQLEQAAAEAKRKARRDFWLFVIAVVTAVTGLAGWAIGHVSASIH